VHLLLLLSDHCRLPGRRPRTLWGEPL